jgi:hypothetical protein
MKTDYWWAPLAGVAFLLLVVAGFLVGGEPPEIKDGAGEVASFYRDNDSSVIVGAILIGIAMTMLIFFAGFLRRALREAEGAGGALSVVAFGGAVVLAVGGAIDATLSFAMAEASDTISPEQLHTLQAVWENDFMPMAVGSQVLLLASGLSIVRHGALARWLGWVAIVLALLAVTPAGFIAFLGGGLWIAIVSVMLALKARAATSPPSDAPPVAASPVA